MSCSKSSNTSKSRGPGLDNVEESGQLMFELDSGAIQDLDYFRNAAELMAKPPAQSIFLHRANQHQPLEAWVLRFMAAAKARSDGALAKQPMP